MPEVHHRVVQMRTPRLKEIGLQRRRMANKRPRSIRPTTIGEKFVKASLVDERGVLRRGNEMFRPRGPSCRPTSTLCSRSDEHVLHLVRHMRSNELEWFLCHRGNRSGSCPSPTRPRRLRRSPRGGSPSTGRRFGPPVRIRLVGDPVVGSGLRCPKCDLPGIWVGLVDSHPV
jgi:hypothetical protein